MLKAKRYSSSPRTFTKRKLFSFLFYFLFILCSFYVAVPESVSLPSEKSPFYLYHGPKVPLNQLLLSVIDRAQSSLYIECYAIDYRPLLEKIKKAVDRGVQVEIFFDPKASLDLYQYFFSSKDDLKSNPFLRPYTGKALMHRKLLIEDGNRVYLGSANFTAGSLLNHENVMIGLESPTLAEHLKTPYITSNIPFDVPLKKKDGFILETPQFKAQFFKLPEEKFAAQTLLYKKIQTAKKTIDVAMFTFTHPKIAHLLEERSLAGVSVKMILDNKQKWLTERLMQGLTKSGIEIATYKTNQMFHHKWAFIDKKEWIVGTVNWTKNGFSRNAELLVFFEFFDPALSSQVETLWEECANF